MKKVRLGTSLFTVLLAAAIMAGCGSSDNSYSSATAEYAPEEVYDSAFESKAVYSAGDSEVYDEAPMAEENSTSAIDSSRKLITTMSISAETEDLDSVLNQVNNKVKELGGYVESSNIYNGSSYLSNKPKRNAYLTLRIPAQNLDRFVEIVEGTTNITNKSTNVEDVTLSYVDIESKKSALKTEEKRLLEILEGAETIEDLLTVEQRLSEVRYELESIESQLRTYDNRINYSTVNLDIDEVTKFTETAKKGPVQRMKEGFVESIAEVITAVTEAVVWFVIHLPQIILLIILGIIIFLIVRAIDRSGKKKRIEKMQRMQQYNQMQQGMQGSAMAQNPGPNNIENNKDNNG